MKARTIVTLPIAIAMLAIPSVAPAAYLVPPENSAATQYTEAYPTAQGSRDVEGGKKRGKVSPKEALGNRNARKLEAQGPEGEAAAEVAAVTAPSAGGATAPSAGDDGSVEEETGVGGAANGSGAAGGGGSPSGSGEDARGGPSQRQEIPASEGSSGIGAVLGEATGASSDGGIGFLLPLTIVAAIAWAMAFLWRQRKRQTV